MKALTIGISAAIFTVLVVGCTKPDSNGPSASSQHLSIKGSDTMVQLAQAWAQDFMKKNPSLAVTVTGGGSNTGFAALINKGAQLANASRAVKPEEVQAAKKNKVELKEFVVAQDALSIIVHPSNPIEEVTVEQLRDIYLGNVTNWSQLGGPDQNIVANGRDSSSGTYVFFQEAVLEKRAFANTVLNNPATNAIVENVSQDAGAIGYVGIGYVTQSVKAVPVKSGKTGKAVAGTAQTVLSGDYPLARPLFQYTAGEPNGATKQWLDWVTGPEGQAIVEKLGFVPVK